MKRPWRVESQMPGVGGTRWRTEATYATLERAEEAERTWRKRFPHRVFRIVNYKTPGVRT